MRVLEFSLIRPSGPGQSSSHNVRPYVVCMLNVVCWMLSPPCEIYHIRVLWRLLKRTVFDQPTVDNGGVSRGRSAAVAIGTSMALQCHLNGTSTAIQQHINGNSTAHQRQFNSNSTAKNKKIKSVLLLASVKRVSVSRIRDFFSK